MQTTQELQALGYLGPADALSSSTVSEPSLLPDPKDKIAEQNLLHAAMIAVDDGRISDARGGFEKVLRLNPALFRSFDPAWPTGISRRQFLQSGRTIFQRARALRPDDADIASNQGDALIQAGNFAAAKSALETSLKRNPGQYRARFLLGSTLLALHEFPAAQDQLEAALLLQPTFEAQKKLAEVLLEQGKFAEARQQLEQAIMVQP